MAALAGAGAVETAYLTYAKLAAVDVACAASGGACASVLSSDWASLFGGVPLPALGVAAYGAVAALSALCAREAAAGRSPAPAVGGALAAGVGALAGTSGYLMWVLASPLAGAPCTWCLTSAALSGALALALAAGAAPRARADGAAAALAGAALALAVLVAGRPAGAAAAGGGITELPYAEPVVTTESSPRAVALAERLTKSGAALYRAFWCSHWCASCLCCAVSYSFGSCF